MVRKAIAVLAAGWVCSVGSMAAAADFPVKAGAPVYDWSGVYTGAHVGYGWQTGAVDFRSANAFSDNYFAQGWVPSSFSPAAQGVLGGVQIGANWQTGRYVFGVEADIALAAIKGSAGAAVDAFPVTFVSATETKLDALGTVRARLGIAPLERSLLYVTGGLVYGRAEVSSSVTGVNLLGMTNCGNIAGLCASGATTKWLVGWTLGAGWEQALAERWSVRLEYLYYDLGRIAHDFADPTPGALAAFIASAHFNGHILRTGLNYRF